ncbi:MAG: hypothetical protein ACERLM_12405, partial [Acidimicrobiales bacterium]
MGAPEGGAQAVEAVLVGVLDVGAGVEVMDHHRSMAVEVDARSDQSSLGRCSTSASGPGKKRCSWGFS